MEVIGVIVGFTSIVIVVVTASIIPIVICSDLYFGNLFLCLIESEYASFQGLDFKRMFLITFVVP